MSDFSYEVIGKRIRDARKRLQLKQVEVAHISHVSLPYYGKLERGELCPNLDRLIRVCKALQLPLTDVFKGVMQEEQTISHVTSVDTEFKEFFSHIADRVDDDMKIVMMGVCRQIETLNH